MDPLLLRAVGIFYSSNKSVMFLHFGQRKAQQTLLWLRCCRRRRCLLAAAVAAAAHHSCLLLLLPPLFSLACVYLTVHFSLTAQQPKCAS